MSRAYGEKEKCTARKKQSEMWGKVVSRAYRKKEKCTARKKVVIGVERVEKVSESGYIRRKYLIYGFVPV